MPRLRACSSSSSSSVAGHAAAAPPPRWPPLPAPTCHIHGHMCLIPDRVLAATRQEGAHHKLVQPQLLRAPPTLACVQAGGHAAPRQPPRSGTPPGSGTPPATEHAASCAPVAEHGQAAHARAQRSSPLRPTIVRFDGVDRRVRLVIVAPSTWRLPLAAIQDGPCMCPPARVLHHHKPHLVQAGPWLSRPHLITASGILGRASRS